MSAKHLLVAFDFSEQSRHALLVAGVLAARLRAGLDIVYVLEDPFSDIPDTPGEPIWATAGELQAHLEAIERQLRHEVQAVLGPEAQTATLHVVRGGPVHVLLTKAEEVGADLLVVAATGKGGVARTLMGSVSQRLVQKSPVPVLSVP